MLLAVPVRPLTNFAYDYSILFVKVLICWSLKKAVFSYLQFVANDE